MTTFTNKQNGNKMETLIAEFKDQISKLLHVALRERAMSADSIVSEIDILEIVGSNYCYNIKQVAIYNADCVDVIVRPMTKEALTKPAPYPRIRAITDNVVGVSRDQVWSTIPSTPELEFRKALSVFISSDDYPEKHLTEEIIETAEIMIDVIKKRIVEVEKEQFEQMLSKHLPAFTRTMSELILLTTKSIPTDGCNNLEGNKLKLTLLEIGNDASKYVIERNINTYTGRDNLSIYLEVLKPEGQPNITTGLYVSSTGVIAEATPESVWGFFGTTPEDELRRLSTITRDMVDSDYDYVDLAVTLVSIWLAGLSTSLSREAWFAGLPRHDIDEPVNTVAGDTDSVSWYPVHKEVVSELTREEVIKAVTDLVSSVDNYWPGIDTGSAVTVMAGAAMVIQGLRDTTADIDLNIAVEPIVLRDFFSWDDEQYDEVVSTRHYEEGIYDIHFLPRTGHTEAYSDGCFKFSIQSLVEIYSFKVRLNREKDQEDIKRLAECLGIGTSESKILLPSVHKSNDESLKSGKVAFDQKTFVLDSFTNIEYYPKQKSGVFRFTWSNTGFKSIPIGFRLASLRKNYLDFLTSIIDSLLNDNSIILYQDRVELLQGDWEGVILVAKEDYNMIYDMFSCKEVTSEIVDSIYGKIIDEYVLNLLAVIGVEHE